MLTDEVKLLIQIEALEELEYKSFWTFEKDEPRIKTVVLYSDIIDSINQRKAAIFAKKLIETLIKIFS